MRAIFIFMTLCFFESCHTDPPLNTLVDRHDSSLLTIQGWGFRAMSYLEYKSNDVVSKKYGFRYEAVAGCTGTDSLIKAVKRHNDPVERFLKMRFGEKWQEHFEDECKEELKREQKVEQYIEKDENIKKLMIPNDSTGSPDFDMTPIDQTSKYYVSIVGSIEQRNAYHRVSYAKMVVDYKTGEIVIVSDKIENIETRTFHTSTPLNH